MSNLVSRDKSESLVLVVTFDPGLGSFVPVGESVGVCCLCLYCNTGRELVPLRVWQWTLEEQEVLGLSEPLPPFDWPHHHWSSDHYSGHFTPMPATKQTFCNLKGLVSSSLSSFLFRFLTSSNIPTDSTAFDLINFYNDTLSSCRNQLAPLKTVTVSSPRPHRTTQIFIYLKSIADSLNNSKV